MKYANLPITSGVVLSGFNTCNFLDHYVFKDPVSGFNIFYPLTAYGGPIPTAPPFTFTNTVTGGIFVKDCVQDYCYSTFTLQPQKVFCVTTAKFVLSSVDQSVSRISKIIYNFGDGTPEKIVTKDLITNASPANTIVYKTYYPTDALVTEVTTTIKVIYDNCCTNTYVLILSCFKCGILDVFEDTVLINAQQTKQSYDVLLSLENVSDNQLFNNLLRTNEPFYAIPILNPLPNTVEPVPPVKNRPPITVQPPITAQPVVPNPIQPPPLFYIYTEGDGIRMFPSTVTFNVGDLFTTTDNSIILSGEDIPYAATPSILIT